MSFDPAAWAQARVLVVGDVMLDRYFWGRVERVSPEAPVPVVEVRERTQTLGGAGNVAANLAGLGVGGALLGLRGQDAAGETLAGLLAGAGVEDRLLVRPERPTTTKTRIMARGQQLMRLDEEEAAPPAPEILEELFAAFLAGLPGAGCVILSDYGKGVLTPDLTRRAIAACRERSLPVLVDPKGRDWSKYRGATAITPNTAEFSLALGGPAESEADLASGAATVIQDLDLSSLLITRGPRGMALIRPGSGPLFIASKAREVFDVSGAGDTVIATTAAGLAAGLDLAEAAHLANTAAGIVVGKLGTRPVFLAELQREIEGASASSKVMNREDAAALVRKWKGEGKRIVFTNGCFDSFHAGHVKLLHAAAALGDKLIVGLNSDESVTRLKGAGRPVIAWRERAMILAALECTDVVCVFAEDTPHELLRAFRPDVLAKGADYDEAGVVGHELVRSWGGEIVLLALD